MLAIQLVNGEIQYKRKNVLRSMEWTARCWIRTTKIIATSVHYDLCDLYFVILWDFTGLSFLLLPQEWVKTEPVSLNIPLSLAPPRALVTHYHQAFKKGSGGIRKKKVRGEKSAGYFVWYHYHQVWKTTYFTVVVARMQSSACK